MSRYIDADKLIAHLVAEKEMCPNDEIEYPISYGCRLGLQGAISFAETQPTADVVEVRHGMWIKPKNRHNSSDWKECSLCGYYFDVSVGQETTPYCPECGAKMGGERREE